MFVYFWLCWVLFVAHRLSLIVVSGGYSLIVVGGLLIAVACLVVEHGLWSVGSVVVLHQLVGSSWTRNRICVPCTNRRILNHLGHQGSPINLIS